MARDVPHSHGNMDIREHQKTYAGFWSVAVWTTVALIILLSLMAVFLT